MTKQSVVDVVFIRKGDSYKVKLKALHNGTHLIEKSSLNGDTPLSVFEYANAFINKHNATKINLKRGMLEDSFSRFLTDTQQNGSLEEEKTIEGVLVDSISTENQELLVDLRTYKLCVDDTIRHKDYESLLLQGVLYNSTRKEIEASEGIEINHFEMEIELPKSERSDFLSAVTSLSQTELSNGLEYFKLKKYNRIVVVTKSDYKLTVSFV